jgi:hypothetical protein
MGFNFLAIIKGAFFAEVNQYRTKCAQSISSFVTIGQAAGVNKITLLM